MAAVGSTLLSGLAEAESRVALQPATDPAYQVIAIVPVLKGPSRLVASPDSSLIYVTSNGNSISVIDTATNTMVFTIPISGQPPGGGSLAISPDGTTLYSAQFFSNAVLLISTATRQVTQTFPTGVFPQSVAVSPNGNVVYVPNSDGNITVILNGALRPPINVGGKPSYVAFTPDGSYAYVANGGSVDVIEVATQTVVSTINSSVPVFFSGMAITPDGRNLYVCGTTASYQPVTAVIDTVTNTITNTIHLANAGGAFPPAITPDGRYLYVPLKIHQLHNPVVIVDLATNLRYRSISVHDYPLAIAITPNGGYAYVCNAVSASVTVIDIGR